MLCQVEASNPKASLFIVEFNHQSFRYGKFFLLAVAAGDILGIFTLLASIYSR